MTKKNPTVSLLLILLGAIMVSKLTKKLVRLGMPTEICRAEMTQWHRSVRVCLPKCTSVKSGGKDGEMLLVAVAGWWRFMSFVLFLIKMKTNTGQSLREEKQSCFMIQRHLAWEGWRAVSHSDAVLEVTATAQRPHPTSKRGSGSREGRSLPTGNLSALQKWLPHNVYLFLPCNLIAKT